MKKIPSCHTPFNKKYPHLTEEMISQLDSLFSTVDPNELRENLLELYHMYIVHQYSSLPNNFNVMAGNMVMLFDFLKVIGEEYASKTELINY